MKRTTGAWTTFLLVTVSVASGSLAVGIALSPDKLPASSTVDPAASSEQVAITSTTIADPRTVALIVNSGDSTELLAPKSGIITGSNCVVGGSAQSGQSVFEIDGRPVLNLYTSTPLWRDLTVGDKGDDVAALQAALNDLGFGTLSDGVLGTSAVRAVQKLLGTPGAASGTISTITRADILWMPTPTLPIGSCDAILGATISAGDPLLSSAESIASARLGNVPTDLVPGDRILAVGGQSIPVGPDGFSPAALAQLNQVPQVVDALAAAKAAPASGGPVGAAQLDVTYQLAAPKDAWGVPATALTGLEASEGCVWSGTVGYPVNIVVSQLGKVFVSFAADVGKAPPAVDLSPDEAKSCR